MASCLTIQWTEPTRCGTSILEIWCHLVGWSSHSTNVGPWRSIALRSLLLVWISTYMRIYLYILISGRSVPILWISLRPMSKILYFFVCFLCQVVAVKRRPLFEEPFSVLWTYVRKPFSVERLVGNVENNSGSVLSIFLVSRLHARLVGRNGDADSSTGRWHDFSETVPAPLAPSIQHTETRWIDLFFYPSVFSFLSCGFCMLFVSLYLSHLVSLTRSSKQSAPYHL